MLIRKSLLTLGLSCLALWSFAQKKSLSHEVYDDWKSIASTNISDDGIWAGYRITPQVGDAVLELRNLNSDEVIRVDRVSRYSFSSNSQFVVAEVKPEYEKTRELKLKKTAAAKMPKDSLYIVNLSSGEMQKFARVKNFQLPDEAGDWVAWLHEKPEKAKKKKKETKEEPKEEESSSKKGKKKKGKKNKNKKGEEPKKEEPKEPKDPRAKSKGTELVLYNMSSGETKSIKWVMEYHLSNKGNFLYYEYDKVDSLNPSGIHALNIATGETTTLSERMTDYKKMASAEDGDQLAFFATNAEKAEKNKVYSLMHWQAGASEAQIVADTTSEAMPDNWMVSSNSTIRFAESGDRLYFGSAPRPMKYAYEEDTTLLKEDKPDVDVWSYNDPYIQPMQKLNSTREKNRSYDMLFNTATGTMTQLEGPDIESVTIDVRNDRDFFIGMNDKPYRTQFTWDVQLPRDFYKINAATGEADLLVRGAKGFPSLSPGGNYLTWYDPETKHWHLMDIATKEVKNLTEGMDVSFANELHDSPSLAGSYGSPGWADDDSHVFIYDRYDVWRFDPKGGAPVNVTNGAGRESKTIYRYQRLDREQQTIPTDSKALVSAFAEWSKKSGYAYADMAGSGNPEQIVMDDKRFYGLIKAKDADRVLVRQSTYMDYPEVYAANSTGMGGLKQLTNVGEQESDFKWGSAELIEFDNTFDGETMQAILYKPENFDPNKKYPMIVYFYERRSNSLHSHMSPAPSASTVNIPYYVSNDYLVLVPDIKYEIGHPGRSAMNHVVPATKAVMEMGFVDEKKMAIQGQSWGGYQVAHIVTRTNLYAAAGAGAPVSNMTSAYGGVRWGSGMSRMFQYEKTQSRLGATLWDRQDLYIENSPIFHMPNIETPLFIMHNDNDGAVPWYQGIEFYMSLRRLGKPAWMVTYNDEAHNLRKRKNRKDLSVRMAQFFDHYLKDAPMPEWMAYGLPATLKGRTLRYDLVDENKQKVEEGQSLKLERTKGQKQEK